MMGIEPCTFKKEAKGEKLPFRNSITGNSMVYQDRLEINLSQQFAHPENSEWLSKMYVFIFQVNIVAERKQTNC